MKQHYKSERGYELVQQRYHELLRTWPMSNDQCMVKTAFGKTFVLSCGPTMAPPLVLLHGAMGNTAFWQADAAVWARHFRLHIVDVLGEAGWSEAVRPDLNSSAYSDWLLQVLDALGVQQTAMLGESMGGWLAVDFAKRHPTRLSKLALLCPAGIGKQRNIFIKVWPLLLLGPWGRRKLLQIVFGQRPPTEESMPPRISELAALIHRNFKFRYVEFPVFSDEDLAQLTMPLYVMLGSEDSLVASHETAARIQQQCPHAQVVLRPGVGHLLWGRTQPILSFLQQSATVSGR
jgi:pimeloyl-ACP methyl ester carboxylesterase